MEEPVENTSSDPISETTPVVPEAMPDTDIVSDGDDAALALESIDTLLDLSRKRNGSVMSEVGGHFGYNAPCAAGCIGIDGRRWGKSSGRWD